jgi:predicted DNA-binding protein with PD1-like motif
MKSVKLSDGYLVRCDIGDEIFSTLTKFAAENGIHSGSIIGIGVLKDPVLGFYDLEKKKYIQREFRGEFELAGLSGNFSRLGTDTILHCHVALSDREFKLIGGHLFQAKVGVTTEFHIKPGGVEVTRAHDPEIGLNLIKI